MIADIIKNRVANVYKTLNKAYLAGGGQTYSNTNLSWGDTEDGKIRTGDAIFQVKQGEIIRELKLYSGRVIDTNSPTTPDSSTVYVDNYSSALSTVYSVQTNKVAIAKKVGSKIYKNFLKQVNIDANDYNGLEVETIDISGKDTDLNTLYEESDQLQAVQDGYALLIKFDTGTTTLNYLSIPNDDPKTYQVKNNVESVVFTLSDYTDEELIFDYDTNIEIPSIIMEVVEEWKL